MTTYKRVEFACACLLLAVIVILVALASVSRAAGSPVIWSIEIAQLLFVWLCMLAADLAMQERRHFGLMLLLDSLPPPLRRWMDVVNHAILSGLLIFLLFYAWRNMVLMHPRLIGATQMHGSIVHASMVVGLALMLRTMIAQLVSSLYSKDAV
ncbi:TRAP transporter small permease subunit [Breoghania sp. L-A4]|uniref:TRAP transporter small permease n=1 Tax=Breoghania sp. L-A4 TaxID=2304600 RepID=UPI000E35A379|nr:TRAP transporter small permease subunit [Breoghania sp. L-A4]AXS41992.1 TRAP transporter small permease subunit [Breoghania sp. L-A4]